MDEHSCNPSSLLGSINADQQLRGTGPSDEQAATAHYTPAQGAAYENVMARSMQARVAASGNPPVDGRALSEKGFEPDMVNRMVNSMADPSHTVPAKVYGVLNDRLEQWMKQNSQLPEKQARQNWQNQIVPGVKSLRATIDRAVEQGATQPLEALGMKPADAYWTRDWLRSLEDGFPFFSSGRITPNPWKAGAENTMSAFIAYNPAVLIGHGLGFLPRAFAKADPRNVFLGIADAIHAGNPLTEHPDLHAQAVYGNPWFHPEGFWQKTRAVTQYPLHVAQTLADNIAYRIGAREGDPMKGVKDIALQNRPWNTPSLFRSGEGRASFSFMRWHLNYTKMYAGMVRDMYRGAYEKNPQKFAAGMYGLLAFSLTQGLLYGWKAPIPAPIYAAMPSDAKQFVDNIFSPGAAIAHLTGISYAQKAQPLGGFAAGVGYQLLNEMIQGSYKSFTRIPPEVMQNDSRAAIGDTIDSVSKILVPMVGLPVNVQKMAHVGAQLVKQEITPDEAPQELKKAFFGKQAVSQ